jgi:hypothetical protein
LTDGASTFTAEVSRLLLVHVTIVYICLVPPNLVHAGERRRTYFFGEGTHVVGSVTPLTGWSLGGAYNLT